MGRQVCHAAVVQPVTHRPDRAPGPRYSLTDSPLGTILLILGQAGLLGLHFAGHEHSPKVGVDWVRDDSALAPAAQQLAEYFEGTRSVFKVALDLRGTPFQNTVWEALLRIPWGVTRTYREVAAEIGRPGAFRAVGAAVGSNPVSIVVPCHRVVGSAGGLVGYGWGLDRKSWLLEHEGAELMLQGPSHRGRTLA
ncbi:MAG: methylated-DNA--[protein]-cysteine S-methyltransferase [Candidatus Dormibacteria bacterium]